MKRRRTMLLSVTATSMAAAIACSPAGQPVGKVALPESSEQNADAAVSLDAAPPPDASVPLAPPSVPDAGKVGMLEAPPADTVKVGKVAADKDAGRPIAPPSLHPDRVGTTATVDDRVSPAVGTTASVPDKKK